MSADGQPRRSARRIHSGNAAAPPDLGNSVPIAARTTPRTGPPNLPTAAGPDPSRGSNEHLDRLASELSIKATRLALKAVHIHDSLEAARSGDARRIRVEIDDAKARAQDELAQSVAQIREATSQRILEITEGLGSLRARSAGGPFSAAYSDPWEAGNDRLGPAELVRRGTTAFGPALYPLFDDLGWYLEGPVQATVDEIRSVVLRSVSGLPLKHLRIDVFDPRIEGALGFLAPLRSVHSGIFPAPATSASAFREVVESLARTAAVNAEAIATEHVSTLGEVWRARGVPSGVYRIVVVLNYPDGIDRETQGMLVRLARSGGPKGIAVLVQHDQDASAADDVVRPRDLAQHLRKSRLEASGELLLSDYPTGVEVRTDGPAPAGLIREVLEIATQQAARDTGPIIALADLIGADADAPWRGDGTDGLEASIARVGQRTLSIALRSQNPPVSNILIGGAVGQGKSNLLLDVIYALAARYSPRDLELHLLDFKRGLEFQGFAPDDQGRNWLPHAKVLSLESDRDFGVAVLRHVVHELVRRAALFKQRGVSGIEDFRRRTGTELPRLLLIVDEFQVLFDGDDRLVDEAVSLLETISRQGRASGVHLLLSSQTTTGVSGLRVKGESIFAQFPLRISLKNTASESEAILSQGNKAAADLAYRGEIVVNRNFGHDPEGSNERAVSAYADPDFVAALQEKLWNLDPSGTGPLVFVSTEFARWPITTAPHLPGEPAFGMVGRPIEVTSEPVTLLVEEDVDQSIAVVGADESLAIPVLSSLIRSLGATLRPGRVIVLDLTNPDSTSAGRKISYALSELADRGCDIVRIGRDRCVQTLATTLRSRLAESDESPTLVVGLGWQRWTGLDELHEVAPEDENDFETFSPREVMEELAQRGALKNVYLAAWWTTLRSIQEQLGFSYHGIRHFVTAKLGIDDYRSLTSHSEPGIDGYPRVGHVDRASDRGPTIAIPFELPGERS